MAALPETPDLRVVDLRKVTVGDLAALMAEEKRVWLAELSWDLTASIDLIERFVGIQALNGCALLLGARVIGYAYFVRDEHKGLIGDLYILARERSRERESLLVEAALESLWRHPELGRVEAQLLMLGGDHPRRARMPFADWFRAYPRLFFEMETARVKTLPAGRASNVTISAWQEGHHEASAWLVSTAYRGHIDSEINDQYRSPSGARRFLTNIVQYPGCGTFFGPASYSAFDAASGALCGICLTSLVAADAGHITQICVAPSHKGIGLGYELLRRALLSLAAHRCRIVSLTVTTSNHAAVRLYEKMGFVRKREFSAWVWDTR